MDASFPNKHEKKLFSELHARGVQFMMVGMSAALLQGARGATEDVDLWFGQLDDPRIAEAVRAAGGVWVSGSFGMTPPMIGGEAFEDRFDVVTHMHGLASFEEEYKKAIEFDLDGERVNVLPLQRIIHSKRAAGRPKDQAQLPALEVALALTEEKNTTE